MANRLACVLLMIILALPCLSLAQTRSDDGWLPLFDGKTLAGWTTMDKKPVTKGWVAEDGILHRADKAYDIFTDKEYANFILEFDWRIAPNGNSGVKYRMSSYSGQYLGPEYQVFDDGPLAQAAKKNGKFLAASLYELVAPNQKKQLKAVGQWNTARIVADGSKIEHWLNGEKVVEIDTASEAFKTALAASKFKAHKDFAQGPSGRIMLQEHGSEAWYRNIRIKQLP